MNDQRLPIIVHCVVDELGDASGSGPGGWPYFLAMKRQMKQLAARPELLARFSVVCPGVGGSGSQNHAEGLQDAMGSLASHAINIICDSDTMVLAQGWDDLIRAALRHDHAVGTGYGAVGSFGPGDGLVQTYKRRPNFTWLALSDSIAPELWARCDLSSDLPNVSTFASDAEAEIFGLRAHQSLLHEVSWRWPQFLHDNRLITSCFDRTQRVALQGLSGYHEEYSLDKVPFVAHQRGASKHPFMSQPHSAPFYAAVEAFNAAR